MSKRQDLHETKNSMEEKSDFGLFYPTDHIVVAFSSADGAQRVRRDLLAGGYREQDVLYYAPAELIPLAQKQLDDAGFLASLGATVEALARYLKMAQEGAHFLVIHDPGDGQTEQVLNLIKQSPDAKGADKYHKFVIESLKI